MKHHQLQSAVLTRSQKVSNALKLNLRRVCFYPAFPCCVQQYEKFVAQGGMEPNLLIELNSIAGRELLKHCAVNHFVDWSIHFECQENLTYCGVASGVISLNLAGACAPESSRHPSYKLWTQENFLTSKAESVVKERQIRKSGMSLSQFSQLLIANGLKNAKAFHADSMALSEFRYSLIQSMRDEKFVVLNYQRKNIGQDGGGHFSPIAAYSESGDSFLVLDVARYRYGPVWVSVDRLFESCCTVDDSTGKSRGFLVFSRQRSKD